MSDERNIFTWFVSLEFQMRGSERRQEREREREEKLRTSVISRVTSITKEGHDDVFR